jgi:hypothetical protein
MLESTGTTMKLKGLSTLIERFDCEGFHHPGFGTELHVMCEILDDLDSLPEAFMLTTGFHTFLFALLDDMRGGMVWFVLEVIYRTIHLSDIAFLGFLNHHPTPLLINILKEEVPINFQKTALFIILKIVESEDSNYCVDSGLIAFLIEPKTIEAMEKNSLLEILFSIFDGFVRNHPYDIILPFFESISDLSITLWNNIQTLTLGDEILSVITDLCAAGFTNKISPKLSFLSVVNKFHNTDYLSLYDEIARLSAQFIHCDPNLIKFIPISDIFQKVGKNVTEGVLIMFLEIALHGELFILLQGLGEAVFFEIIIENCEFRIKELVLEILWSGFLSLRDR